MVQFLCFESKRKAIFMGLFHVMIKFCCDMWKYKYFFDYFMMSWKYLRNLHCLVHEVFCSRRGPTFNTFHIDVSAIRRLGMKNPRPKMTNHSLVRRDFTRERILFDEISWRNLKYFLSFVFGGFLKVFGLWCSNCFQLRYFIMILIKFFYKNSFF